VLGGNGGSNGMHSEVLRRIGNGIGAEASYTEAASNLAHQGAKL